MAEQEKEQEPFIFNISLSVLNHLGRDLYRNFITVLGEAISNSWDAGAKNVWIEIDKENGCFSIKDDGHGMSETDFRTKFLNVGYSRREDDNARTPKNRTLIGGKGIGKLALLSCAERVHITSKTSDTEYMGAIIDNGELDKAIDGENKAESKNYELAKLDTRIFENLQRGHNYGTIIYFENMNKGINNSIKILRKLIAMHFRFSLTCENDDSFSIFVDGTPVGFDDLKTLSKKTEFLWVIDEFPDPFLKTFNLKEKLNIPEPTKTIEGFIASVEKPSDLNILSAGERIGIDVFVNGRLRETNILRHLRGFTARVFTSYLYGQIHLNTLDDGSSENVNRFTTSREGIKPGDEVYKELLQFIKEKILSSLGGQWDKWRLKHKQDGDSEETDNLSKHQRGLKSSKEAREKDFEDKIDSLGLDDETTSSLKEKLHEPSQKNTEVYQDLFMLENLFREFLKKRGIKDTDELLKKFPEDPFVIECVAKISDMKGNRAEQESSIGLIKIVETEHDLNYLDLVRLGILVDKVKEIEPTKKASKKDTPQAFEAQKKEAEAKEIRPVRNAVMHTNQVSKEVMDWPKIKKIIVIMDKLANKPTPKP